MASLVQFPYTHLSNMDFSRFSGSFRQIFRIIFILLCLILEDLIGILVSAVKSIASYRNLASGHAFPAESSQKTSFIGDKIRGSSPVILYRARNRPEDGECAVCLCRFDEGEEIRELKCRHAFHRGCLDTWLDQDNTTCPLCRSCLLPKEPETGFWQSETEFWEELLLFWYSSAHGANLQSSLRLC